MTRRSSRKPKVLYAETYAAHDLKIKDYCLPTLPSAAPGFVVDSAYITKAGRVEFEGRELEFQDVRIYLREEQTHDA